MTITASTSPPRMARWCRRKRRHVSDQSESALGARPMLTAGTTASVVAPLGLIRTRPAWKAPPRRARAGLVSSAEGDPGVEPSVQEIGHQVEDHHENGEDEVDGHDHRRVVG